MNMPRLPVLVLAGWMLPGLVNAQTELANGLPETVSGADDSITAFYLNVPAGLTSLVFSTSGGSGDPDIYVNFGQPYLTTADPTPECVSSTVGTEEYCEILNPTAGLWYVEVYAFTAYSNTGLLGIAARQVTDGSGITIAGATDSTSWFYIEVPANQSRLTATTSGGTGDPDIYVVEEPDLFLVQESCSSVEIGPADSCEVASPAAGRWYVLIYGFEQFTGVNLLVNYAKSGGGGGGGPLPPLTLAGLLVAGLLGIRRRRLRGRPVPPPTA